MKFLLISNFLRVGLFFSRFLFVCCELPTKNYTAYQRYPFCCPSDYMQFPTNSDRVVEIVKEAISRNVTIKAFGARHSQTDVICTDGIPIDMTRMKFFKMNSDNVTASFGPGVTIREAGEFLYTHGRALRTTPAYGNITLGGAIGTGAHGSTIKYNSSISEQVVQMTIVDGRANVQVISNPDDLQSFKIHLGLLGIVVNITLFTVPLYKVLAQNYVVSDEVLTNGVALEWLTTDQIMFYWFPTFNQVVVSNLTFVPSDTPGKAWTNILPPTSDLFNICATKSKDTAYSLISTKSSTASTLGYTILHALELIEETSLLTLTPLHEPYFTEDGLTFKTPAVGYPHLMVASTCSDGPTGLFRTACSWAHGDIGANITFLDNEFSIAVSNLSAFVKTAKDIFNKTPTAFLIYGMLIRFSNSSDIYMSTAYKRATAHIGFYLYKSSDPYNEAAGSLAGYQTISQVLTKRFDARSHWGKSGLVFHDVGMLKRKLDPVARDKFVAAMKKFDPNGIFQNNFGRRITQTGTKIDFDPLTTRCGLLDNCFCSKNSDCAESQTCTSITGYNYPVCKTINESLVQVDENSFPPMPDLVYWLNTTVPILAKGILDEIALRALDPVVG